MTRKHAYRAGDPRELAKATFGGRLSPEYREVVDATVALLHHYKTRTGAPTFEPAAPPSDDRIREFTHDLWHDWRAVWHEAAECLLEIAAERDHLQSAKEYTESRLTPELLGAPLWRQAYTKPSGFPGDYQVMDYIYQGNPCGDTLFGQVAHGLGVLIGQFVVKRKDLVHQAIAEVAANQPEGAGRTVIASLGSGPAREIAEFLQSGAGGTRPLTFVLVDQDSNALRYAGRNIAEALEARRGGPPVKIDLRHLSILRLLREVDPSTLIPEPDMIYSAGLFDYFGDRTCRVLSARLYDVLRPDGLLLLGNMKAGTDMIWPLEMIADWSLTYRTAENILTWADGLQGAEISLRTEATGYDYLLRVRKRG